MLKGESTKVRGSGIKAKKDKQAERYLRDSSSEGHSISVLAQEVDLSSFKINLKNVDQKSESFCSANISQKNVNNWFLRKFDNIEATVNRFQKEQLNFMK